MFIVYLHTATIVYTNLFLKIFEAYDSQKVSDWMDIKKSIKACLSISIYLSKMGLNCKEFANKQIQIGCIKLILFKTSIILKNAF